MKRIEWTLIAYFLFVHLSFGFSEERQDSCVWSTQAGASLLAEAVGRRDLCLITVRSLPDCR
jgi:hypothetical protein